MIPHNCLGILPKSIFPRSLNIAIEESLSPIHFGMVPDNLFSPRSSVDSDMLETNFKQKERFPERLLLLNCNQLREGSENIELGMSPDRLFLDRSM